MSAKLAHCLNMSLDARWTHRKGQQKLAAKMGCRRRCHRPKKTAGRGPVLSPFEPPRQLRPAIAAACAARSPQRCATTNNHAAVALAVACSPLPALQNFHSIAYALPLFSVSDFSFTIVEDGGQARDPCPSLATKRPPALCRCLSEKSASCALRRRTNLILSTGTAAAKFCLYACVGLVQDRLSENRPSILLVSLHDHCACSKG